MTIGRNFGSGNAPASPYNCSVKSTDFP
jgi:hypothetical protein